MKSTKVQKQYNNINGDSNGETEKPGTKPTNSFANAAPHRDELLPTRPTDTPSVGQSVAGKKETVPPEAPNSNFSFRDSAAGHDINDFRPTSPGNSPGVGHSFPLHEADVESKAPAGKIPGARNSLTGVKDYRPTMPGHSPGVGHILQDESVKPNEQTCKNTTMMADAPSVNSVTNARIMYISF